MLAYITVIADWRKPHEIHTTVLWFCEHTSGLSHTNNMTGISFAQAINLYLLIYVRLKFNMQKEQLYGRFCNIGKPHNGIISL